MASTGPDLSAPPLPNDHPSMNTRSATAPRKPTRFFPPRAIRLLHDLWAITNFPNRLQLEALLVQIQQVPGEEECTHRRVYQWFQTQRSRLKAAPESSSPASRAAPPPPPSHRPSSRWPTVTRELRGKIKQVWKSVPGESRPNLRDYWINSAWDEHRPAATSGDIARYLNHLQEKEDRKKEKRAAVAMEVDEQPLPEPAAQHHDDEEAMGTHASSDDDTPLVLSHKHLQQRPLSWHSTNGPDDDAEMPLTPTLADPFVRHRDLYPTATSDNLPTPPASRAPSLALKPEPSVSPTVRHSSLPAITALAPLPPSTASRSRSSSHTPVVDELQDDDEDRPESRASSVFSPRHTQSPVTPGPSFSHISFTMTSTKRTASHDEATTTATLARTVADFTPPPDGALANSFSQFSCDLPAPSSRESTPLRTLRAVYAEIENFDPSKLEELPMTGPDWIMKFEQEAEDQFKNFLAAAKNRERR
ncbi:Homeobox domain-containing protein [Mycena chlorophos]|uniref:Homeobox domain-containing protein n=1 Tax=Mycena chlorophos TaxID=658473 RepID=A0A8H6SFN3_MYCCL|nr:Homeobox domain-containing protein [Mycena chlorophos]